jgi:hypothetical protein
MKIPHHMVHGVRSLQSLGFSSTIVAGGAPRDLYHNKQIKDIDFFLMDPLVSTERIDWNSLPNREQSLKMSPPMFIPYTLGLDIKNCVVGTDSAQGFNWILSKVDFERNSSYSYGKEFTWITQIWNLNIIYHVPLQFIFTNKNPTLMVEENFDIGMCVCYFDGQKIRYSDEFITDATQRQLTVRGQLTTGQIHKALNDHIPRLQRKYPGYTIEYAPHIRDQILQIVLT